MAICPPDNYDCGNQNYKFRYGYLGPYGTPPNEYYTGAEWVLVSDCNPNSEEYICTGGTPSGPSGSDPRFSSYFDWISADQSYPGSEITGTGAPFDVDCTCGYFPCSDCDNCYPGTGTPVSFCGCSQVCDPNNCRRCCPVAKCSTVTLTFSITDPASYAEKLSSLPVAVDIPEIVDPSRPILSILDTKEKNNLYNVFFDFLKKINKNNIPLKNVGTKFSKLIKKKEKIHGDNFFSFSGRVKNFNINNDSSVKWFYFKEKNSYLNYFKNIGRKLNYFYWSGKNWINVNSEKCFLLKHHISLKEPFYVIFDDNFDVVSTSNVYFYDKNINFLIAEENENLKDFVFVDKHIFKEKNIEINFLGKQINEEQLALGSSCPCGSISYTISVTLSRKGAGCGFCKASSAINLYGIALVGYGCYKISEYSDTYIKCVDVTNTGSSPTPPCIYHLNSGDSSNPPVVVTFNDCGLQCGLIAELTNISDCPKCRFYSAFNLNSDLVNRRQQYKKYLQENKKPRLLM